VQWVVKIRLATRTHPGYPGYAFLATKARDKCVSTLGITLYESEDRYHHHQANDITHPNESFEASLFLSSDNTFKDSIHYLVVIASICESTASSLLTNQTPGRVGTPAQIMHWNVP
jgi:hypothetical protein